MDYLLLHFHSRYIKIMCSSNFHQIYVMFLDNFQNFPDQKSEKYMNDWLFFSFVVALVRIQFIHRCYLNIVLQLK